jgi:hypothetical protein
VWKSTSGIENSDKPIEIIYSTVGRITAGDISK